MKATLIALATVALAAAGGQAEAAIIYQADAGDLAAAISPLQVEDFSDTTLLPGLTLGGLANSIMGGVLISSVQSNKTLVLNFADAIRGFGVDYDLTRNGVSTGLDVSVGFTDGTKLTLNAIPITSAAGYYGFTSDVGIRSVTFGSGQGETFTFDNLRFGSTLLAGAVPEPASWALMILGFGGIGASLRRRRRPAMA